MLANIKRIQAIASKEFIQLARDNVTFAMIVLIPLIQLALFGYAINTKVTHLPVGLVDLSRTALSRFIAQEVAATNIVNFKYIYPSIAEAEKAIVSGAIKAAFIIPSDAPNRYIKKRAFMRLDNTSQFQDENLPIAQWIVDGTDTVIAGAIKGLRNLPLVDLDVFTRDNNRVPSNFEVVQYYNPEQKTVVNIVPGLIGIILTMTMVLFTSVAIVRERERGNLEFLLSTPVKPLELMLGKIVPYIFIGLAQVAIILSAGRLIFSVPIIGEVTAIALVSLLFIFASLTLGLLISTVAKTQFQSMQMTFFILLPSILLSGFMFPYEGMPVLAQWVAEAFPTTHFMRMIRAVSLKQAELNDIHRDIGWHLAFTALMLSFATVRFRKRLD